MSHVGGAREGTGAVRFEAFIKAYTKESHIIIKPISLAWNISMMGEEHLSKFTNHASIKAAKKCLSDARETCA